MEHEYRIVRRQAKLTVRFSYDGREWDALVEVDEGESEQAAIDSMLGECKAKLTRDKELAYGT